MRTVLITGAASGIGRATALLFQKKGWNVAATMRNPTDFAYLSATETMKHYRLDVTDRASIEGAIASAISDFGQIDVVVNNAGIYTTSPLESTRQEDIRAIVDTNILGTVHVIQAILPHYRKQKCGTIVNVSSIAGRATFPYQTIYHGTKWAIEGISEGLSYELRNINVAIKIVEPGMVKTKLYDNVKDIDSSCYPREYAASFSNWHKFLLSSIDRGYDPSLDAKTIYKAATDGKSRLRYVSDGGTRMTLLLKALLPQDVFSSMVRGITRTQGRLAAAER